VGAHKVHLHLFEFVLAEPYISQQTHAGVKSVDRVRTVHSLVYCRARDGHPSFGFDRETNPLLALCHLDNVFHREAFAVQKNHV